MHDETSGGADLAYRMVPTDGDGTQVLLAAVVQRGAETKRTNED